MNLKSYLERNKKGKQIILFVAILLTLPAHTNAQAKMNLPFVGKKYFEDKAYSTTYVVTIRSNGTVNIMAGGPGINNKGWTVYVGKYKSIMNNKEEGVKIEAGFLYLLSKKGEIRKDCLDNDDNDCLCKFNIKTTELVH